MGSSNDPDAAAKAMSVACRYVRRNPKFAHWLASGDVNGTSLLRVFKSERAIRHYIRTQAHRRETEILTAMVDTADTFVNHGGQASMLVATYVHQRESGQLELLNPTRRAVHRAVFSLGVYYGSPVLASMRYLQVVLRGQSSIEVTPATISNHVKALTRDGLFLDFAPGDRYRKALRADGSSHRVYAAGRVWLDLTIDPEASTDARAVVDLELTANQRLTLMEYADSARLKRDADWKAECERLRRIEEQIILEDMKLNGWRILEVIDL